MTDLEADLAILNARIRGLEAKLESKVEVVRCRDCIWRGTANCAMFYLCACGEQHTWETDDDFCSYGERGGNERI